MGPLLSACAGTIAGAPGLLAVGAFNRVVVGTFAAALCVETAGPAIGRPLLYTYVCVFVSLLVLQLLMFLYF